MIRNPVLRQRLESLLKTKSELSKKKHDLGKQIADLGITTEKAKKYRSGKYFSLPLSEVAKFEKREEIRQEYQKIEKEIISINKEILLLQNSKEADRNTELSKIFKEIFSHEQMKLIGEEVDRRLNGEQPSPIGLNFKDFDDYKSKYYSYREKLRAELDKTIEFRIRLTGLIEKGCNQFGEAEFLKFISPLNQLVLPLAELEKIKKQFLL